MFSPYFHSEFLGSQNPTVMSIKFLATSNFNTPFHFLLLITCCLKRLSKIGICVILNNQFDVTRELSILLCLMATLSVFLLFSCSTQGAYHKIFIIKVSSCPRRGYGGEMLFHLIRRLRSVRIEEYICKILPLLQRLDHI